MQKYRNILDFKRFAKEFDQIRSDTPLTDKDG